MSSGCSRYGTIRRTKLGSEQRHNEGVRPQLWLWPNLLSLDAPLVAVLWQTLFLRCLGAPVRWLPALLLFLTVWLIYVADRLLDARNGGSPTPRHTFYRRNFRWVLATWIVALAATMGMVLLGFANPLLLRGLTMLGAVFLYLAAVHWLPPGSAWVGLKEAAVAVLFALGTSLPAWGQIRSTYDALTVVLFSALCWLNCIAIEQWESNLARLPVAKIGAVIAVAGLVLLHHDRPILAGAESASLFALVLLDGLHHKFSRDALRVLADVALLTPLVFLPVVASELRRHRSLLSLV